MSTTQEQQLNTAPKWRFIRQPELLERVGLCAETVRRLELKNEFPRRIKLTPRSCAWLESEVDAWLENQLTNRRARSAPTKAESSAVVTRS
jgi:prophage regulatory protein